MELSRCGLVHEIYSCEMSINKNTLLILPIGGQSSVLDQFNETVTLGVF